MQKNLDLSVYLILDPLMCGGFQAALNVAEEALSSGISMLQLRAPTLKKKTWFDLATELKPLCRVYQVPLIINDHVDVAMAVDADGVHIGQDDLPIAKVRDLLGADKIIGLSISRMNELISECLQHANYLGIGPIFDTLTKLDTKPALGFDGAKKMIQIANMPSVLIGGLKVEHVSAVKNTGAHGLSVVSAICANKAPAKVTRLLRASWDECR